MKQEQEGGESSINLQAARDVHVSSLSVADVKSIAELVFEKNLPQMMSAARHEAQENAKKFFDELSKQASQKLSEEEMAAFASADMQYALTHAVIQASRKEAPEKSTLLASLIVEKAKCTTGIRDAAITQAIEISAKLIKPHFSLLAFTLATKNNKWGWTKAEEVIGGIKNTIKYFSDMPLKDDGITILVGMGCAIFQPMYGHLEDNINGLYGDILPKKYNSRFGRMSKEDSAAFWQMFDLAPNETALIEKYNSSAAAALSLSSIGKAIALAYMQSQKLIDYDWKPLLSD